MILEPGCYISNGSNSKLLVCDVQQYKEKWYAYMLNEENDEVLFYQVTVDDKNHNFSRVKDEKLVQELILAFAKDYVSKNPDTLLELEELGILNKKEENNHGSMSSSVGR